MFDVSNDSSNLYICLKASDISAQSRLMHAGFNLWFDPSGHKKEKQGIGFPLKLDGAPGDLPKHNRSSDPSAGPSEKSRASRLKEKVLLNQSNIKVAGLSGVTEPLLPLQNKYGLQVAFDWDSLNILSIEYKIPLALIFSHPPTNADFEHPVGLSLVVGAEESAPRPSNSNPQQQGNMNSGQRNGMGGNRMGSGMNTAGSHGMQYNSNEDRYNTDNQEQKVWLKLHLESNRTAP